MINKIKKRRDMILLAIVSAVMVLLIVNINYMINGVYPYGKEVIPIDDCKIQVVAMYTHLWDAMHGKLDLFYDWYTGLGTSMAMSVSSFSMLSPFNYILYFFSRGDIEKAISILIMLKTSAMAFNMTLFLDYLGKRQNNSGSEIKIYSVCGALLYSFSGYSLMYSIEFNPWLDCMAIFPLLMLALMYMLNNGKITPYIIIMALMLIINWYISGLSLIYVFLFSGLYILMITEKDKKGKTILLLGLSTLLAIGISMLVLYPVILQFVSSERGSVNGYSGFGDATFFDVYKSIISQKISKDTENQGLQRWIMIYGMSLPLSIITVWLTKKRENKKIIVFNLSLIIMMLWLMMVEGTNLIWHFGSYNGYVLRNGFMIAFTFIMIAYECLAEMITNNDIVISDNKNTKKNAIVSCVIFLTFSVLFIILYNKLPDYKESEFVNQTNASVVYLLIFAIFFMVYFLKFRGGKKINLVSIITLCAIEMYMAVLPFSGVPKFYKKTVFEQGNYNVNSNELSELIKDNAGKSERIVNPDTSLGLNYPMILKKSAISSYTAAVKEGIMMSAARLGYSDYIVWLQDRGGTVFTEALFGVNKAISRCELNENLYTKEKTYTLKDGEEYNIYTPNYTLPFIMKVNAKEIEEIINYNSSNRHDFVNYQNLFYKALKNGTNEDDLLLKEADCEIEKKNTIENIKLHIDGKNAVYFYLYSVNDKTDLVMNESFELSVNGEKIVVPYFEEKENTYLFNYNEGALFLGVFEDENVDLKISFKEAWQLSGSTISIGLLDLRKLEDLCVEVKNNTKYDVEETKTGIYLKYNAFEDEASVILPVVLNEGISFNVNGEKVQAKSIAGFFSMLELNRGENEIEIYYKTPGRTIGGIISLISIILLLLFIIISKQKAIIKGLDSMTDKVSIYKLALYVFTVLYLCVVVLMFVGPLVGIFI